MASTNGVLASAPNAAGPVSVANQRANLTACCGFFSNQDTVLYLGDEATVQAVAARLGVDPVPPANPYWAEHGLTFEDPDGFRVVLVPEHWEN
jgi:hypothetical protein